MFDDITELWAEQHFARAREKKINQKWIINSFASLKWTAQTHSSFPIKLSDLIRATVTFTHSAPKRPKPNELKRVAREQHTFFFVFILCKIHSRFMSNRFTLKQHSCRAVFSSRMQAILWWCTNTSKSYQLTFASFIVQSKLPQPTPVDASDSIACKMLVSIFHFWKIKYAFTALTRLRRKMHRIRVANVIELISFEYKRSAVMFATASNERLEQSTIFKSNKPSLHVVNWPFYLLKQIYLLTEH